MKGILALWWVVGISCVLALIMTGKIDKDTGGALIGLVFVLPFMIGLALDGGDGRGRDF